MLRHPGAVLGLSVLLGYLGALGLAAAGVLYIWQWGAGPWMLLWAGLSVMPLYLLGAVLMLPLQLLLCHAAQRAGAFAPEVPTPADVTPTRVGAAS